MKHKTLASLPNGIYYFNMKDGSSCYGTKGSDTKGLPWLAPENRMSPITRGHRRYDEFIASIKSMEPVRFTRLPTSPISHEHRLPS